MHFDTFLNIYYVAYKVNMAINIMKSRCLHKPKFIMMCLSHK